MLALDRLPASAAPPVVANDPAHPSPVEVTAGSTYVVLDKLETTAQVVCAVFVNHGPRTATRLTLSFAMVDASGTVIGVDLVHPRGNFAPGSVSRYTSGGADPSAPNANCDAIRPAVGGQRTSFWYRPAPHAPPAQVAAVLVSAREVIYDDGSSFKTDNIPKGGDHVELPPAPAFSAPPPAIMVKSPDVASNLTPQMAVSRPAGAPVEITQAYQQDVFRGSAAGLERGTCVVFASHDARPVKHVRVNLAIGDRSGTVAGVQTMDVNAAYVREIPIAPPCAFIAGWWTDQGFVSIPQGRRGPTVLVGTIVAVPITVDFEDGTSWNAPNPPQTGDAITALVHPGAGR